DEPEIGGGEIHREGSQNRIAIPLSGANPLQRRSDLKTPMTNLEDSKMKKSGRKRHRAWRRRKRRRS
ncbi:hypothetical protein U1Q18_050128, partial [Sarracenia purpurea var. burkii]